MIRGGKWRRFLAAALCGAGMLTMAAPMAAASVRPCDVGNHNDYGGGDYGGGDYGGGYGGYYGDDDGGYDDDGDYGSSSEVTPVNLIFAGVVILLIVVMVSRQNRGKGDASVRTVTQPSEAPTPGNHDEEILRAIPWGGSRLQSGCFPELGQGGIRHPPAGLDGQRLDADSAL